MALDTLTAKANVGAGTDTLAGRSTASGFVGAVMMVDPAGIEIAPALAVNQETANDTLASIDGKLANIGQAAMAASSPVVIASNQSSIPVKNEEVATAGAVTANAQRVTATVSTGNAVAIQLDGTHAGVNLTFEISNDGTVWDLATAVRSGTASPLTATGVLTSNGTTVWHVYCGAAQFVSVRSTAYTSGTLNVRFRAISIGSPTAVVVQPSGTQPVSGSVTATLAAATVLAGDVGIQYRANATGAATINHIVSAATTNTATVKGSAGRLLGWDLGNTTAVWQYVKLHNTAGAVTAGAGVVKTIAIPPGGKSEVHLPGGIGFTTGIGRSIVTGAADTDATATTLNAVVGDLFYA
jgi:hypothetical protein